MAMKIGEEKFFERVDQGVQNTFMRNAVVSAQHPRQACAFA